MRFDQRGSEPTPDPDHQPSPDTHRHLPFGGEPEPARAEPPDERFDWLGLLESLVRHRQSGLISASFVFALSPLLVWAASGLTRSSIPAAIDARTATSEALAAPAGPAVTFDPAVARPGPTARYGGRRSQTVADIPATTVVPGPSPLSDGLCHDSYTGCVPIAVDVDCEGDGDGPFFVTGPLLVTGDDVYHLDPSGDFVACHLGDG